MEKIVSEGALLEDKSVKLLYEMLRIRRIEEAIANRYSEQKMRCPVHLSIGQEAVAVGVCQALCKADSIYSNHRAHAHYLAKGGSLPKMIAEIYGKQTGCCGGRGGSMHLTDLEVGMVASTPIVGSTLPVAVGSAFAAKRRKEERIVVVFFGEGATEEGVFAESLNFAALHSLPLLFVCEHNYYSVYSPMEVRQPPKRNRLSIASAHGIPTLKGDGNEVKEVFELSQRAIDQIREGKGPFFVEFVTYRSREHCGPNRDDALGYRSQEEIAFWEERDPLKLSRNWANEEEYREFEQEISQEIEEAFAFAERSPFPEFHEHLEAVYASNS